MNRPPTPARVTAPRHRLFWRLFPLVWLLYLYFPLHTFLGEARPRWQLLCGLAGLAVFLAIWVGCFWQRARDGDWRQRGLLGFGYAWSLLLYGLLLALGDGNGLTFLVYAAGIIGFQGSLSVALFGLFGVLAAMLAPGWFWNTPFSLSDVVQFLLLASVSMFGTHASYRQGVANVRLARVQAEKERLAADAERERIARDLHDLLGHTLSVIVLKSELAGKLASRDPERAAQEIREVERISREALSEVRSAVRGYQGSGLNAELARSKLALHTAGVRLELDAEPLDLPSEVEYAMEMVLREAVTNVVRHARARVVTVRLARQGRQWVLDVSDDGAGRGGAAEGTGLTSMRERVRAAGGQFSLSSGGAAGTTLRASFPPREGNAGGSAPRPVGA